MREYEHLLTGLTEDHIFSLLEKISTYSRAIQKTLLRLFEFFAGIINTHSSKTEYNRSGILNLNKDSSLPPIKIIFLSFPSRNFHYNP